MAKWFRAVNPDQGCLLPADIRSWLPPGHLAWQILGVTGELDLSGFAAAYRADGQGQAPYDPAMMLALVLYCYFKGIRSSRKIRDACVDDLGCRVICGGAVPSHRAVAEFLRRHRGEVRRLFVQVLGLLADVRSVGVQGDGRSYGHPVVLRPVTSEDAMTADWARLPDEVLARISTRITNEVPEVNRVVLDVTSKPPATIEWE